MNCQKKIFPKNPANVHTPWLWIGTWSMGGVGFGPHDERDSLEVLEKAAANNICHFDTAGFYGHGRSEKLLQKVLKTNREEFFIASKGGLVWSGRKVEHRASKSGLKRQLYESLDRLKTDYLDLYQLHWPDPKVPVQESICVIKEFQRQGLIRFWGVCNLNEEEVKDYLKDEVNIPHQVHFNPVHQNKKILLAGKDKCINCIVSPLEQGLLGTGISALGKTGLWKKDFRNRNPHFSDPKVLAWNKGLHHLLKQNKFSKVSLILLWICAHRDIHVIIPGPRKLEQLEEILRFKNEVFKNALISEHQEEPILSMERVKKIVPKEDWQHLSLGPFRSSIMNSDD